MMPSIPEEHRRKGPRSVKFAVIIVSTSRYEAKRAGRAVEDRSGDLIVGSLAASGHKVVYRAIVPDDRDEIIGALSEAESGGAEAIIFSGGTGISPRDVTIEAIEPLLSRKLPGFGEILRYRSYEEIGPAAMLTRSIAGTRGGRVIFVLPGSPNAASIALEQLILPEVGHILVHLRE